MYLGSWKIDDYVPIPVTTHKFSTGAAFAPTVLTYSIYEDGGTTGIAKNVDMTPASPFDGVVGFYLARPQLTAAAGFEKGKNYTVLIKATVDSVAAITAHTFQIEAEVDSNSVSGTVPTVTAVTNGVTLADDAITSAKFDESTAFPVKSADTGATQIARVGADSDTLETLSDEIAAVKAETEAIIEDTGTTLDIAITNGFDGTSLTAVQTAITDDLDEIKGTGWSDENLTIIDANIDSILEDTGTTLTNEIPAAVIEYNLGSSPADSLGKYIEDILEDTGTTLDGIVDGISESAVNIYQDTQGLVSALTVVDGIVDDILEDTGTTLDGKLDTIDGIVDDIKAETDTHPTAGEIWANAKRTLTYPAGSSTVPEIGDPVEIYRDTTVIYNFEGIGDISAYDDTTDDKIWITFKTDLDQLDSQALIQILALGPGAASPGADTLLYINGVDVSVSNPDDGTLVFTDKVAGNGTMTLKPAVASLLPIITEFDIYFDIKGLLHDTGVVTRLSTGTAKIIGTSTRTIT